MRSGAHLCQPALRPAVVQDTPLSRLWYKRDDQFWLPKANFDVLLHSYVALRSTRAARTDIRRPQLNATPRNAVLAQLFCDLFRDSITEDTYDADLAELSFNLWYAGDWIGIGAAGFSDKLAVLTETMLQRLMEFEVDDGRFDSIVDDVREAVKRPREMTNKWLQLRLSWKNWPLSDPYRIAAFWGGYVTSQSSWTKEEQLQELDCGFAPRLKELTGSVITAADVRTYGRELMQRLYIESLIHGNTSLEVCRVIILFVDKLTPARVRRKCRTCLSGCCTHAHWPHRKRTSDDLFSSLHVSPFQQVCFNADRVASEHVWSMELPNKAEVNSAVVYQLHVGSNTDRPLRAALQLFAQIAHEPAFDQLRTKQQLGYIVDTQGTQSTGSMGFRVLIQSEKDPVYVETCIEGFLDGMKGYIEEMSEEEFEKNKQSLIAKKEEKPKNLGEETRRYFMAIADRYYEFGKRELRSASSGYVLTRAGQTDVSQLHNTTKADVLNLLMTYFHTSSPTRAKLSTHLRSQYKGIKFDASAAAPLVEAFTKHHVAVDNEVLQKLMMSKPDLQAVRDFATAAVINAEGLSMKAKIELEETIEGLQGTEAGVKSEEDKSAKLRPGNVFIEDIHAFKAGLTPSKAAMPLEPIKAVAKL